MRKFYEVLELIEEQMGTEFATEVAEIVYKAMDDNYDAGYAEGQNEEEWHD